MKNRRWMGIVACSFTGATACSVQAERLGALEPRNSSGRDEAGSAGESAIELQLAAGSARTISASELEDGGEGLMGEFGDGQGKWQLFVASDDELHVVNLLDSATGNLTNLSARGADNFSE